MWANIARERLARRLFVTYWRKDTVECLNADSYSSEGSGKDQAHATCKRLPINP